MKSFAIPDSVMSGIIKSERIGDEDDDGLYTRGLNIA